MIPTPLETLQTAWRVGFGEFIAMDTIGDKSFLTSLLQILKNIRYHNLLREGKNELFVRHVYDDIRNIPEFYTLVMSASTTFNLAIPDQVSAVEYFVERAIAYSDKSAVVDVGTLSRRAPNTALKTILEQNAWLFMLLVGSVLESVTVDVVQTSGRKMS